MPDDLASVMEKIEFGNDGALDSIIERIAALVGQKASAKAVFGDPVERGGVTVIPVAKVRWGFGGGSGAGTGGGKDGQMEAGEGGGGGGGVSATPMGYIEVRDGEASFRRIVDPFSYMAALFAGSVAFWIVMRALRGLFH